MDYFHSNVSGTLSVVESSRLANVKRLVYAASASCYGIPDIYPTPETAEIRPQYPYALTKNIGEEIVMHWGLVYKLPVVPLRFFNVYGPRSRTSGAYGAVFGVFLAQKLAEKPFTIVGDGNQTRDFTFADITKIKKLLGWSPKTDINEGVAKMLENIDYWREAPVWTKESIAEATKDWFKYLS